MFGDLIGNATTTFVNATSNIKTSGNVLANNLFGYMTGNVTATFFNATANIKTNGNVIANIMIGDLTGNATATFVNSTANIKTSGNVLATNLFGGLTGNVTVTFVNATANIKTNGNVIANIMIGDLTGNVSATFVNSTANIKTSGNVLATNLFGGLTGNVTATFVNTTANIKTNGNVFSTTFFGDLVGNVSATFVNATSNIRTNGNVLATNLFGDLTGNATATFVNTTSNIRTTGNVLATNLFGDLYGNVPSATFVNATADINTNGNMFAATFFGDSTGNVVATFVNATANIKTNGNVLANNLMGDLTGNATTGFVNATGNVLTTTNVIVGNMVSFGSHVQNNLLSLRGSADPASTSGVYCFGINASTLRYQSATVNSTRHKFWTGVAQVASFATVTGGPDMRLHPPDPTTQQTAFIRNDGTSVYFMSTVAGDTDGAWTTARPYTYNLALGTGTFGGDVTLSANVVVQTDRVMQFTSTTQNCIINLYPGGTTGTSTEFLGFGVNSFVMRNQAGTGQIHSFTSNTNQTAYLDYNGNAGWGTSPSIFLVSKNTLAGGSRSINAAGTVNINGLDYAEYMVKAGDFDIPKGSIVGINSVGKVTNRFADAVSFAIKSSDPSLVGGDTWCSEESIGVAKPDATTRERWGGDTDEEHDARMTAVTAWETAFEVARSKVDRISFAGQVPCNVMGAVPGQYIVPQDPGDGSIEGRTVSVPTEDEYLDAVGKVIRVMDDGRAFVIVKVS